MSSNAISAKINGLRGDADTWKNVAWRLSDEMFMTRALQLYLEVAKQSGYDAADQWVETAYPEDASTDVKEGITPQDIRTVFEKVTGQELTTIDPTTIDNSLANIQATFRQLYGRQMVAQMQVNAIQDQIENLHSAQQDTDGQAD